MNRVLVIGNAGAGKSTFSKKLADITGLPLIHLDRLYWTGNWDHRSREEFDILLQQELEKPQWILDGNFSRTVPHRLAYCDTVFFFDLPVLTCLWGVTQRVFSHYGRTRPDMGGNCPEFFDAQKPALYRGILNYNKKHRREYYRLFADVKDVQVVVFRSRRQADRYLRQLPK